MRFRISVSSSSILDIWLLGIFEVGLGVSRASIQELCCLKRGLFFGLRGMFGDSWPQERQREAT